ncbi:YggS family pyridoxal phosphate-dependent enzyme [bacterium]|nr:YggS family pyridoxal phosphate-dependent enzyme [bacterium]
MIAENIKKIRENIARVAHGRNVQLIAVSKTVSADRIGDAYHAGIESFGENRIQEAIPKIAELGSLAIDWHFIGHLQTNKARDAVRHFSWIQSIDSHKLLIQIEKEAAKQNKNIHLLLELNLGSEESKHGLTENDLMEILEAGSKLEWCKILGLMIIPPYDEDPEKIRPYFRKLREIRDRWQKDFPDLTELSMGMSNDYEVAIEEGATMVRIGTSIFGSRL